MLDPGEIKNIAAGASGSAIAAWLARAVGWTIFGMFFGGLSAAYFIGPALAEWFSLSHQEAAVGFVVGFLSIMVMRGLVTIIEGFQYERVGGIVIAWLKKRTGVE